MKFARYRGREDLGGAGEGKEYDENIFYEKVLIKEAIQGDGFLGRK